jgi:hypothetical protein
MHIGRRANCDGVDIGRGYDFVDASDFGPGCRSKRIRRCFICVGDQAQLAIFSRGDIRRMYLADSACADNSKPHRFLPMATIRHPKKE